ncbi:Branching enzyme [Handroanthus impetiginosus]|uniref:Branching enzyme n=1 Tax=Handroanthus impetiginosus TaxID=429701 RepID=A0A2G9G154_9LAMI|nr:Branching enzyme [Handroanthus impetiginosus]
MRHDHLPPSSTTAAAIPSLYIILTTTFFTLLLILTLTTAPRSPSFHTHQNDQNDQNTTTALSPPPPPSLAYLISGSINNSGPMISLFLSIYHPRNQYLLQLDRSANQTERDALEITVQSLLGASKNVRVIGMEDYVFSSGPSALSSTLQGASVLLRLSDHWDWFINLSASDYPLVTQDDLLHILSYLPRDVNFVNHTSYIGWRESWKLKGIIVDSALFLADDSETFYATQKRHLPDAFRPFTGSSVAILILKFIEFCIMGFNNLPRTLLMYLSNTALSTSVYFPTVLCNSRQFKGTLINHSLHYASPNLLNSSNFDELIKTGAAFASPFALDDPVLDRIDQELLQRNPGKPVPGGWCLGESSEDQCGVCGETDVLKPSPGAKRLEKLLVEVLSSEATQSHQCVDK